ncbi:hypothetical protein Ddc_10906 [Ditylenchus destructor]|nr:hypothetical protein Ddc_10906 [Ditylenchus destructor]
MLNASGRDDDPFGSHCYRKVKGIKEKIVKCEKEFPYQSGNMTIAKSGKSDKSIDTSTHLDSSTTAPAITLAQFAAIWIISIIHSN